MKKYTELDVGDVVSVIDTASNNDKEYTISITSVEYDEDFVTKTNPKGVHYSGVCLDVLFNDIPYGSTPIILLILMYSRFTPTSL